MDQQESKLPAAEHRRSVTSDPDPCTPALVLPNPHRPDPASGRNWSDLNRRAADSSGSRDYSRPARGSSADFLQRDRPFRDPQEKTSKNKNGSQGRIKGKMSAEAQKKGFGARSAPNLAGKSTPADKNLAPFEVKMADFPELAGVSASRAALPVARKESWGSSSRSAGSQTPDRAVSWRAVRKLSPTPHKSPQSARDARTDSPVVPAAQQVATSWANIASQPPKKPAPADKPISNNAMLTEDIPEERAPGKKKRKKKKKTKSNVEDDQADPEEAPIYQEPPKFEDEEEFPGLTVTLTGNKLITSSNAKLSSEENQREGGRHQHADLNKEKSPGGKTQPAETAKKGQKMEKVSGKKSKVPVQLDIGNVLAALEKQQQSQKAKQEAKPVVLSVGGGLPVVQKQPPAPKKPHWQQDKIAHNPLDSTSPLVKKGKQREVPKAKKPTPLKKVILKEREERKQKRLLEERGMLPEDESKLSNDAAEEQSGENDSDMIESSTAEVDDHPELDETNPVEEGDEETDQDESVQQQIPSTQPILDSAPKIHSRKFRDYCNQMLRKEVDECVTTLLKELVRFQDRLYHKDPMKARMKRRIVMGLREVLKHLKLRKVKCVIISPNCERVQAKGKLWDAPSTRLCPSAWWGSSTMTVHRTTITR
ncbi:selenocysteine insertion sequence-binding protein 2-like isoform X2 [Cololabis saira]|uniref:selenocysteine insertion sequence-binding protein 2-like isoform X2 n=1 Tax=Cololabis saira TaxID=129043 RepID=UPI002AD37622|nr:selenocysteine insertion sequence-binding protein 2-like isoform X2 [Cololabis saira]